MALQFLEKRADGEYRLHTAKCKRCGSDRLWVDFERELQCLNCDPPQQVYRQKLEAQKLKRLANAAQVQKTLDEELEDHERETFIPRRSIILPQGPAQGTVRSRTDRFEAVREADTEVGGSKSNGEGGG